jgi:hypothetical protein
MARDRSVTVRVQTATTCHFHHKVERIVESPKIVTEVSGTGTLLVECIGLFSLFIYELIMSFLYITIIVVFVLIFLFHYFY